MQTVIELSLAINDLERALAGKRAELAALLEAPVKEATGPVRRPTRIRVVKDVNVSAEVLDYLGRHPLGRTAAEVIRETGLESRATSVRSALKKHLAADRVERHQGVWTKKKGAPSPGAPIASHVSTSS